MMNNPLLDYDFLNNLMSYRHRKIYARLTLLTQDELPIEYIEGRVTGGSINIDSTSALRRTCNLTMVLKDQKEINEFNWTFKSKFKLEIGLENNINSNYPNIIWFRQGIFILTTCNMSQSTNNYTITINGKDKMCLLNGDIAGTLLHTTDFGVEEYVEKDTNNITYKKVLLKDIILNAVKAFGGELAENIIINDLEESGLELLEYRGDEEKTPLYLFRDIETGQIDNVTIEGNHNVYLYPSGEQITVSDSSIIYATTSNLVNDNLESPTQIKLLNTDEKIYNIMKFEYGDLAGYRFTDLVYAGDLIANIGESLTSILDKIKNMLGNFEYFYNLDGKFVFQKKRIYASTPWTAVEQDVNNLVNDIVNDSYPKINLMDGQLISAFQNNPNLLNVKNDFAVWGTYKSITGADIPIHMRYALDTKPTYYKTIRSIWTRRMDYSGAEPRDYLYYKNLGVVKESTIIDPDTNIEMKVSYLTKPFSTNENDKNTAIVTEWREIIYQMALDYYQCGTDDNFFLDVAAANPHYPTGRTGYEQYYADIQGFWRQLYNPNPENDYIELLAEDIDESKLDNIYVENYYRKLKEDEAIPEADQIYVIQEINITNSQGNTIKKETFYPFIGSKKCCLTKGETYYYYNNNKWISTAEVNKLNQQDLKNLYINKDESVIQNKLNVLDEKEIWIKDSGRCLLKDLEDDCKIIYKGGIDTNTNYVQYLHNWVVEDNFGTLSKNQEYSERITYVEEIGNIEFDGDTHWNNNIFESPETLIFWFDFLETEGSDLYKYSVKAIGNRPKAINDSNVKNIYYRDTPTTIFTQQLSDIREKRPGYTFIQLPSGYTSLFTISSKGKSAKDSIDELLQNHSYCIETANITAIPLYHLEPGVRILIKDEKSNIDGEYIVSKITIPLTYNGTMNISATKAVSNIL